MIEIATLTEADRGRWVTYCTRPEHRERGRIKSWNDRFVYVVYRCGDDWDNFADFTAAPTLPQDLSFE